MKEQDYNIETIFVLKRVYTFLNGKCIPPRVVNAKHISNILFTANYLFVMNIVPVSNCLLEKTNNVLYMHIHVPILHSTELRQANSKIGTMTYE